MMDVVEKLANRPNREPGDYIGADGLLHCGKCRAAKQARVDGIGCVVPINCRCSEAKFDQKRDDERKKRVETLRARCLPVEAMRKRTFTVAGEEKHIRIARRYVEKWQQVSAENIGLMFWGNTGSGKTFTVQCIANALIDQEIPVKYVPAVELVANLMDNGKRDAFMADVVRVPLLIIDDVGAERDTPFSREQLCAVVDARSEAKKPLVVTTNVTNDEMKKCTDYELSRLYDRLQACCTFVSVIGDSKRGEIAAQKMQRTRELLEL